MTNSLRGNTVYRYIPLYKHWLVSFLVARFKIHSSLIKPCKYMYEIYLDVLFQITSRLETFYNFYFLWHGRLISYIWPVLLWYSYLLQRKRVYNLTQEVHLWHTEGLKIYRTSWMSIKSMINLKNKSRVRTSLRVQGLSFGLRVVCVIAHMYTQTRQKQNIWKQKQILQN